MLEVSWIGNRSLDFARDFGSGLGRPLNASSFATLRSRRRLQMAQFQLNKQATVMTRLTELLRIKVIVRLQELGEVRGVIEQIVAPAIADDLQRSIEMTQFKVKLDSGETVTVPGSAFSKIEYAITQN
jgi:hypothetical protein